MTKVLFLVMQMINSILFAIIAVLLSVYTWSFVDPNHYFIINLGWNTSLIEAKMTFYLIAGLGIALAIFYAIFSGVLYSKRLIYLHVFLYLLLVINILLWDNNSFSLQEVVESQGYNSIGEVKSQYSNVADKDHAYRVFFWILLSLQTIGLFNLLLGFFKSNKN